MAGFEPLSPEVSSTLSTFLGAESRCEIEALARGVRTLSTLFTRKRDALQAGYLDDASLRNSYVAYFVPVNVGKIQTVLEELPPLRSPEEGTATPLRLLDVGSGPGSASLAVLDWMLRHPSTQLRPLEAVLVDRSRPALHEAVVLLNQYVRSVGAPPAQVEPVQADLRRNRWMQSLGARETGRYDLIIIANCLNELFTMERNAVERRVKLVARLLNLLADGGSLVVIEPATRAESRSLLTLRDSVVAQKLCNIYSPCLHDGPCPALVQREDWCHEERPWTAPWFVTAIDKRVGFIKDALKFSYLVLRKDGRTIVQREPSVFRMVSELRHMKGEKRAWLCNETGRTEVGRLDRARSEPNRDFDAWHRGAIVKVEAITRRKTKSGEGAIGRIPETASVEMIRRT